MPNPKEELLVPPPQLMLKPSEIEIDEGRQRKTFDKDGLQQLGNSIQKRGLINPLTVRQDEGGVYHLVAGERRLKGILMVLGDIAVPCRDFAELDPYERRAIELEENLHRSDLTPTEETEALAELHEVRVGMAGGEKTSGHHDQSGSWGVGDTAELVGVSLPTASRDLELGQTLVDLKRDLPDVYKYVTDDGEAKSKTSIKKKLDRLLAGATRGVEAEKALKEAPSLGEMIENGDAVEGLKQMPEASVDLTITDPPWGVLDDKSLREGLAQHAGREGVTWNEDNKNALELWKRLCPELYRVHKDGTHLYIFCNAIPRDFLNPENTTYFVTFAKALVEAGFLVRPAPLTWVKDIPFGYVPDKYQQFPMCTEAIIFARKGIRPFNEPPSHDYFIQTPVNKDKIHLAEKPCSLISRLIDFSGQKSGLFLDPFVGSGAHIVTAACHDKHPMRIKGFESSPKHYNDAVERLHKRLGNAKMTKRDLPALTQMEA